ncbi:MAG: hypothetical protein KAU90_03605 [Sulfurovaceae bacterium]|nr:hypothetical protein [Sulfurovaceae bacterium]
MSKVFISGSISIKKLPKQVMESIQTMIKKNMTILVGDASGIDSLVQDFCNKNNYLNVIVYTITSIPRYKANQEFKEKKISVNQDIKSERERQTYKDKAMSEDSIFSLVIWDGSSKGSYNNIIRALENERKVKIYYQETNQYIENKKVTINEIDYIYREKNGYSASEVIALLQEQGIEKYKRSQDLNKFLLDQNFLIKEGKIYKPTDKKPELFIIEKYRGKISGIKFSNKFIDWIETNSSKE